jgi:hypothetical protein
MVHHALNTTLHMILQMQTFNRQYSYHWKRLMHRDSIGVHPYPGPSAPVLKEACNCRSSQMQELLHDKRQ